MTSPAPGWYPDPSGEPQTRWWNGIQWDAATQPLEAAAPTPQVPAGWYADPTGAPHERWWDGTQWHDATQAPAANSFAIVDDIPTYASVLSQPYADDVAAEPRAQVPARGGYTPMGGYSSASASFSPSTHGWASEPTPLDPSTTWVWGVVWSPLIYALGTVVALAIGGFDLTSSSDLSSNSARGLSVGAFIGMLVLARNDGIQLKERGFSTFGWGWMFFGPLVWLIGRTVMVHRQAGRGIAPLLAWLGTNALYVMVVIGVAIAIVLPELNAP